MSTQQFHSNIHDNGVAELVIDRAPVNALNAAGWNGLAQGNRGAGHALT
jgi:enoyl-CoA hydratase